MRKTMMAAAVAITVLGTACSALGRQAFQQPDVKVADIKLTGIGLTGGSLDVLLDVANPNEYRLDATRMTYKVMLDSVQFASGLVDNKFTVDGGKTTQVRVPVNFTFAGIGAAGRQLLNTGGINYQVTGDVTVGTVVGNFTVPFTSTGRVTNLGGTTR